MSFERPNIAAMTGYTPGEQPDDGAAIKLNTNENPYPPSDEVVNCLRDFDARSLRRYPPPLADGFRREAAQLHRLEPANIIATNGGDELLRLALTTFVDPGETVAIMHPSYSLYPVLAEIHGCTPLRIPLSDDWSMPSNLVGLLGDGRTKMLLLVNPHAPSGTLLASDYLDRLAGEFPGVLLVDEAYVDFVDPSLHYDSVPLLARHENILLLRTLSKGYSLAGLRFGYGLGAGSLISPMLCKTRDSYNTDAISQRLAQAALASRETAARNWARVRQTRATLIAGLNELGLATPSSQSNFVLATVPGDPGAETLYRDLKARNILVRYFDQDSLRDKLRISVGTDTETAALLATLGELLGSE